MISPPVDDSEPALKLTAPAVFRVACVVRGYFLAGIGESHPAMSDGFIPFTNPPNANVDGVYGPTKLMSLVWPDARLEADRPQRGVDGHPAEPVVQQIF